jgi:antitoxin HicB
MLVAAKLELVRAMKTERMTKYKLGKLLKLHPPQVDRLVSIKHRTRMEDVERALAAVGRKVWAEFSVVSG